MLSSRRRRSSSPSADIPSCRSMIASTLLQPTIPNLTRSSLHRCLQRHGIPAFRMSNATSLDKRKLKTYPPGYFHVEIAELRTEEGKFYLFVAIDRTSEFVFVALHEKGPSARPHQSFLHGTDRRRTLPDPYGAHRNGIQFTEPTKELCDGWTQFF